MKNSLGTIKRMISSLLAIFLCLVLSACRSQPLPLLGESTEFSQRPTKDGVEDFLTRMTGRVETYEHDECWNITPDFMKEHTDYQVFKYSNGCDAYLLYEDTVTPIGQGFGGMGLTSLALGDLNKDGLYEVYYSCSWGSGIHHSSVGYFDLADKEDRQLGIRPWDETMLVCRDGQLKVVLTVFPLGEEGMSFIKFTLTSGKELTSIVFRDGEIQLDRKEDMERNDYQGPSQDDLF